jgi:multisubunit Na+/H+ antiporter MnhE subunit
MALASRVSSKNRSSSPGVTALVAVCLAFGWVWLVAGTHLHEMMVGAGVVVLATLFLRLVHRSQANPIQLHWKDVAQGWRIPWYMVCDTWVVILLLLRDLLHLGPAGSYYRVCGFKCSRRDPAILGRGVLATIYMTATPNSIVLGIDPQSSKMLFHQLERANVPKMARALGAQS